MFIGMGRNALHITQLSKSVVDSTPVTRTDSVHLSKIKLDLLNYRL